MAGDEDKSVREQDGQTTDKKMDVLTRKLKSIPLSSGMRVTSGDEFSRASLAEIIYVAVHPQTFRDKVKAYRGYVVVGVALFVVLCVAYWDALTLRHGGDFQVFGIGILVGLLGMVLEAFYLMIIRPKTSKVYPLWSDVNTEHVLNYYRVGGDDAYEVVAPFYEKDGTVYRPTNPFDAARPLLISIDKRCIYRTDRGLITLGKLFHDRTGRSTFRLEMDEQFLPNPDTINLSLQLKISNLRLDGFRLFINELRSQLNRYKAMKIDNVLNKEIEHLRRLSGVAAEISRSPDDKDTIIRLVTALERMQGGGGTGPRIMEK